MSRTIPRTTRGMSTYASVVISPATTTSPVVTSTSQATRPSGSWRSTSSRTPSEIWSAILSGWPSVTDSEVNRYSLSVSVMGRESVASRSVAIPLLALVEVDDDGDALERVAVAQAVLDEVRVVAGDARAAVDLDGEARRGGAGLGPLEQL